MTIDPMTFKYRGLYEVENGCLGLVGYSEKGRSWKKLCNFTPYISKEITQYEEEEPTVRVYLRGRHESGRELPEIEIDAAEVASFKWLPTHWGMDCILEVGKSIKEELRYAIQTTHDLAEHQTVYTVTGWRKINEEWEYLLPGNPERTVTLQGKNQSYGMCEDATGLDLAFLKRLLTAGPVSDEVLLPLLALVFLSPLNHFLKLAKHDPKFVLLLVGRTGTRKSSLAALMLSFFGNFTAADLPMSFQDTANSIGYNSYVLKDVLTCIDDFHPATRYEEQKQTETAQKILRVYGDRAAKGRLHSDCTPMEAKPPQGNAIITAEFPPDIGESGAARYFAVELTHADVDLSTLGFFQEKAAEGVLVRCMHRYIEWLKQTQLRKPDAPAGLLALLKKSFLRYRKDFYRSGIICHGRVAEAVAWLRLGMEFLLSFLEAQNVIGAEARAAQEERFREVLYGLARKQAASIAENRPVVRFLKKLLGMLEAGQACVLPKDHPVDYQPPNWIGYEDERFWYLFSDPAHKAVKEQCERQGESFTITSKALLKQLAEEGCLEKGNGENTKKIRVGGIAKRVVWLYKDRVKEIVEGLPDESLELAELIPCAQDPSHPGQLPESPYAVSENAVPLP